MTKSEKHPLLDNYTRIRIGMFLYAGLYTVIMIAITGGIGYFLDRQFGTYPKLLIIGLFLGYPATIFVLRRKLKEIAENKVKKINND